MNQVKHNFRMSLLLFVFLFGLLPIGAQPVGNPAYKSEPWFRTGGPIGGLGYDIR